MSLFKKKKAVAEPRAAVGPWDEKTVEYFAKSARFNVQTTHVTKRFGFGCTRDRIPMSDPRI